MLRVAGDVRSNTAPTLFMYHSLFLREHNRQAGIFRKKYLLVNFIDSLKFSLKNSLPVDRQLLLSGRSAGQLTLIDQAENFS